MHSSSGKKEKADQLQGARFDLNRLTGTRQGGVYTAENQPLLAILGKVYQSFLLFNKSSAGMKMK